MSGVPAHTGMQVKNPLAMMTRGGKLQAAPVAEFGYRLPLIRALLPLDHE